MNCKVNTHAHNSFKTYKRTHRGIFETMALDPIEGTDPPHMRRREVGSIFETMALDPAKKHKPFQEEGAGALEIRFSKPWRWTPLKEQTPPHMRRREGVPLKFDFRNPGAGSPKDTETPLPRREERRGPRNLILAIMALGPAKKHKPFQEEGEGPLKI